MKYLRYNRVLALVLCAVLLLSQTGLAAPAATDSGAAGADVAPFAESPSDTTSGAGLVTITAFDPLGADVEQQTVRVGTALEALTLPDNLTATGYTDPPSTPAPLTIAGVTWVLDPANPTNNGNSIYDSQGGSYVFTSVLPKAYQVADDASLPEIQVTVDAADLPPVGPVSYLDEAGVAQTCPSAAQVSASVVEWPGGWYVVTGHAPVERRITVTGQVHLILADGAQLDANQGIDVSQGNSLTIYAQSIGETAGKLTANGNGAGAGIGGGGGDAGGTITISGGTVTAEGGNVGIGVLGGDSDIAISGGALGIGSWSPGMTQGTSTFTTGERTAPGHAFIVTNSIKDQSNKGRWSGVVIEGNTGAVYGGAVTLTTDATLPQSMELDIPQGMTLAVAANATLTVEGTIRIKNGGTLVPSDNLINNGTITSEPPPWVPDYSSGNGRDDDDVSTPAKVQTKVDGTVKADGTATVNIPDKTITDAIDAAKDQGGQGGIFITIQATGTQTADSVEATLSARALKALAEAEVRTLTIECAPLTLTLDLGALKTLLAAGGDVTLTAMRQENAQLSAEARAAVGHRPVYQLTATAGDTVITQFGGQVGIAIPYTPAAEEAPASLCAVYVDDGGQVEWLEHADYDQDTGAIQFTTDHFSAFGIGYRTAAVFTDVQGHWAAEEIAFVVARGC